MIKRYVLLSLGLHLMLSFVFLKKENKQEEKLKQETLNESQPQIIEIISGLGELPKQELKNFFWGIGIEIRSDSVKGYFGHRVTDVKTGYCAETAGIQIDDIVYLLDNQPLDLTNDIRGEEPKKLKLTIDRNGSTIVVYIDRCKIYY